MNFVPWKGDSMEVRYTLMFSNPRQPFGAKHLADARTDEEAREAARRFLIENPGCDGRRIEKAVTTCSDIFLD